MDSKRKPNGYWNDFATVERELIAFIEEQGNPGIMPSKEELKQARCKNLASAIDKHGGCQSVAERMELTYARKRPGYWEDFLNLERELLAFIEEHGTRGVIPTQEELIKAGRKDLVNAIQKKHGGRQPVSERLGLRLLYTGKPPSYWEEFTNLEREVLAFIKEYGKLGVMPTHKELLTLPALKRRGFLRTTIRQLLKARSCRRYTLKTTTSTRGIAIALTFIYFSLSESITSQKGTLHNLPLFAL